MDERDTNTEGEKRKLLRVKIPWLIDNSFSAVLTYTRFVFKFTFINFAACEYRLKEFKNKVLRVMLFFSL